MSRHEDDAPNYEDADLPAGWLPTLTPRWREVEDYSAKRKISLGEAVRELINAGLSHAT